MLSGSVALVIALLSSLGWAAFDASRKGLVRHASPASLVVMFGAGQLPCFLLGMGIWGAPTLDLGYLRPGLTCLAANVAANLMFFHAVKVSPISRTVPLLALTPVFAALIGYLLLDEHPSPRQWFGIALIVLGAWTLNAGQGLKGLVLGVLKERMVRRGVPVKNLDPETVDTGSLGRARQVIRLKQGIPQDTAKEIAKDIRDLKLKKVQAQIQGDQLRVQGPSRDDLQEVIAFLKGKDYGVELTFGNYR